MVCHRPPGGTIRCAQRALEDQDAAGIPEWPVRPADAGRGMGPEWVVEHRARAAFLKDAVARRTNGRAQMASDFENLHDVENLSDDELRELVQQQFREIPDVDAELVDVSVEGGTVRLSGRVGTEQELQQFEHELTDVLGVSRVNNELVVDELVRGERSEAADYAAAEAADADPQWGNGARRTEDSAKHLLGDTSAELYGTRDPQEATEGGLSYEPPDRPIQEGTQSRENH